MLKGDYWICYRIYTSKSLSEYAFMRLCTTTQQTREQKSHMESSKACIAGLQVESEFEYQVGHSNQNVTLKLIKHGSLYV